MMKTRLSCEIDAVLCAGLVGVIYWASPSFGIAALTALIVLIGYDIKRSIK